MIANLLFFFSFALEKTCTMTKKLSHDEMAGLLQGDISNLEELDEGEEINIDNINKV